MCVLGYMCVLEGLGIYVSVRGAAKVGRVFFFFFLGYLEVKRNVI